uniref:Uncharacterized protein n=1 Tax=Chromera velia CCMP2878 TaxID=1169474 RepID=A0A0G4GP85_9ALVE|eukprot:Cvel_22735.t1-p1 / transcript=Cvel_22735.t1 / gene=Cvel_22735 / organism=Chromera_velia_CCMP2878 / gene_product=hypothetical protein / transcript_product=hypothetical protein / location=Cvel_scaffold2267:10048-22114(+) / protein_length=263 / sequence_SO=supercontig / SO=protein_coding / is_pseudo=false
MEGGPLRDAYTVSRKHFGAAGKCSRGVSAGHVQGRAAPAAAKLGRHRRTVIHCGESGRGAARPFPCSAGRDLLFTVLTEPAVSVGAVTWGERMKMNRVESGGGGGQAAVSQALPVPPPQPCHRRVPPQQHWRRGKRGTKQKRERRKGWKKRNEKEKRTRKEKKEKEKKRKRKKMRDSPYDLVSPPPPLPIQDDDKAVASPGPPFLRFPLLPSPLPELAPAEDQDKAVTSPGPLFLHFPLPSSPLPELAPAEDEDEAAVPKYVL